VTMIEEFVWFEECFWC